MRELTDFNEGYMQGYEAGFDEGYSKAIYYLVNNPTSYERIKSGNYNEEWQIG